MLTSETDAILRSMNEQKPYAIWRDPQIYWSILIGAAIVAAAYVFVLLTEP